MALNQTLMIRKFDPVNIPDLTSVFERTDNGTDLPKRVGVRRRDLYEYQGTCLHLVQCDQDFVQRLRETKDDPDWRDLDQALRKYLSPTNPARPGMELLTPFYTWINE